MRDGICVFSPQGFAEDSPGIPLRGAVYQTAADI
jgi:hypothetical protein